jgi:hypothetical protein
VKGKILETIKRNYRDIRTREITLLLSYSLSLIQSRLKLMLNVYILLNFLDVITTLAGMSVASGFVELNPLAANLFKLSFPGFIAALSIKYLPIIPLFFITFFRSKTNDSIGLRIVKLSGFVTLVAANMFYCFIVTSNTANLVYYLINSSNN